MAEMMNPSGRVVAVADSRVEECLNYGFKIVEEVKKTETIKKPKKEKEVIDEEPVIISEIE